MISDEEIIRLIKAGLTDEEIAKVAHANTKPADLYGAVAEVVTDVLMGCESRLHLIHNSDLPAIKEFSNVIKKSMADSRFDAPWEWWKSLGISRSDTKSIVMTYLYGSTEYGNRDSINERIQERDEEILEKSLDPYFDNSGADVWKEQRNNAVTLMVRLTRGAMAVVCPSTVRTMDTIQSWAEALGTQNLPYKVKTPLGFLVIQANRNEETRNVQIREDGKIQIQLFYRRPTPDKTLNERKMKAGAAPNTVHAFDACHLQMSCLATDSQHFHMIHDSMATQCADTPALACAIRDTFIEMYGDEDTLFNIWELNEGDERGLKEPDELGSLDISDVNDSLYFFS